MDKSYTFKAKIWLYPGNAPWHMLTLPKPVAKDIDYFFGALKRGWGSLRVSVKVGDSVWETSIFTDKKSESFILPLKAKIRKQENISAGDEIEIKLTVFE